MTQTRLKKTVNRSFGAIATALFVAWLAIYFGDWPTWQPVDLPQQCDVIVVLGGGSDRDKIAQEAIDSVEFGRIIVSGDGGKWIRRLDMSKKPDVDVIHETHAQSTWENAVNCKPLIAPRNAQSILLITNWFHQHRARRTFESVFGPDYEIRVWTDDPPKTRTKYDSANLRRERFACLYYGIRYGVSPW